MVAAVECSGVHEDDERVRFEDGEMMRGEDGLVCGIRALVLVLVLVRGPMTDLVRMTDEVPYGVDEEKHQYRSRGAGKRSCNEDKTCQVQNTDIPP